MTRNRTGNRTSNWWVANTLYHQVRYWKAFYNWIFPFPALLLALQCECLCVISLLFPLLSPCSIPLWPLIRQQKKDNSFQYTMRACDVYHVLSLFTHMSQYFGLLPTRTPCRVMDLVWTMSSQLIIHEVDYHKCHGGHLWPFVGPQGCLLAVIAIVFKGICSINGTTHDFSCPKLTYKSLCSAFVLNLGHTPRLAGSL